MSRSVNRSVLSTLFRQGLQVLIGIATLAVIARQLGVSGTGIYGAATLFTTLGVTVFNFGIQTANVYFLARNRVSASRSRSILTTLWISVSLVFFAPSALLVHSLGHSLIPGASEAAFALCVYSIPLGLAQIWANSVAQGTQRINLFNFLSLLPFICILSTLITSSLFFDSSVEIALLSTMAAQAFSLILTVVMVARIPDKDSSEEISVAEYLKFAGPNYLSLAVSTLSRRLDVFIVGWLLGTSAMGIYGIARDMAERLMMPTNAITTVLLPRASLMYSEMAEKAGAQLTVSMARLGFVVTATAAFGAGIVAPLAIPVLFGSEFSAAVPVFWAICLGLPLASAAWILSNDLTARGKPWLNVYSILIVAAVQIGLVMILLKYLGVQGAAVAFFAAQAISYAVNLRYFARESGLSFIRVAIPTVEEVQLTLSKMNKLFRRFSARWLGRT